MALRRSRPGAWPGWIVVLIGVATVASRGEAQQLTGRVSLGLRGVDVDGATTKYREDINLDDGPRLVDLSIVYAPGESDAPIDRLELDASSLGGEPFESVHFGLRKFGKFDFKLDRRRSQYFYADVIVPPELASITGSTGGDFHHFDYERIRDTARFDFSLTPATELNFDFERYSKSGTSTTTLDVQRDEFELDRPIDETFSNVGFGLQHAWDKVTLIVEERVGDYENGSELILPGFSEGQNTADAAVLEYFRFAEPYRFDSRSHAMRFVARPTQRLKIQGGSRLGQLDLDMDAAETSSGIDFTGLPFETELTGFAMLERDSDLHDVDLSYGISDRIQLVASARDLQLDQTGRSALGTEEADSSWLIETRGIEAGVEIAIGQSMFLGTGWSTESRDVDTRHGAAAPEPSTTDRDGFFVVFEFDPEGPLRLTASIEDNAIDDPYTLSSPSDTRRYRVGGRYSWANGLAVNASFRRYELDNAVSGWSGETEQTDLRLSYEVDALELSAGVARVEASRDIQQLVTGGTRQDLFAIAYASDSDYLDTAVRWEARPRLTLGANLRRYDNAGSFSLERDEWRVFAELDLGDNYLVQLALRDIAHTENGFDDYDAKLVDVAFGLRW